MIVCRSRHWCLLEALRCRSAWREEDLKGEVGIIPLHLCKKLIVTAVIIQNLCVLAFTGRFGQSTPPLVEFLKDILRRYPEGGQILKVSVLLLQFIGWYTVSIYNHSWQNQLC